MPPSRTSKPAVRRPKPSPAKSSKASRSPSKSSSKPAAKAATKSRPKVVARKASPPARPTGSKKSPPKPEPVPPIPEVRRADGRRHLLSLSFVRDGDEFLARLETDSGHITELKNRALDQLLTLVAGELEDLLE
jgi:hypothetical protein